MTKYTTTADAGQWEDYDDYHMDCWQCGGQGHVIIGNDMDSPDPINGPYDGDIVECPCCGGSGLGEDCTYW
jgi:hypothetical protein